MNIFISYTLRDGIINNLDFKKLKSLFIGNPNIFIHIENQNVDSHEKIRNEIINSDVLILLHTREAFLSNWVRDELQIAESNYIPIFILDIEDLREM